MKTGLKFILSLLCLVALSLVVKDRFALLDNQSPTEQEAHEPSHDPQDTNKNNEASANNNSTAGVSRLNLSDSAFSLDQYKTLLEEPYRSYPCQPKRIHVSQFNNVHDIPFPPNETNYHNQTTLPVVSMTISFMLDRDNCANARPKIIYRQGFHPERTLTTEEHPLQFNFTSSIVDMTKPFQSDWIHHVTLPNLKAGGHRYFYRIEVEQERQQQDSRPDEATVGTTTHEMLRLGRRRAAEVAPVIMVPVGATPKYSFLTPPLPYTPTAIALVGDLGQTRNSTKTMAHIFHDSDSKNNKNPTTLLMIAGDMAYADSDPQRWLSWFDLMEPLTRSLTMHVAAGNHEIECDNVTLDIFKQYEHYFHNPNRLDKAEIEPITEDYRQSLVDGYCSTPSAFQGHYNYGNAFYSFQHGYAHFIVLSSYSDARKGSRQYDWLLEELTFNVNRTLTPWLLVSFHSPLYTTFTGHVDEQQSIQMKKSMEPLFHEFGVNLVISGHDHGYMRTHSLLVNGTVDPSAASPVYLTLGAGGNREQHSRSFRNETNPEDFVAVRDLRDYGYANLLITNATHAILNWVRDGVTKEGIDDKNVWIVNGHAPDALTRDQSAVGQDASSFWHVEENGSSQQFAAVA